MRYLHPACVKLVASLDANGTSKILASVFARRVFPLPVGPLHRGHRDERDSVFKYQNGLTSSGHYSFQSPHPP